MTLREIRNNCLRRYGLEADQEHPFFTVTLLNSLVNAEHRALAEETLCYESTREANVTAGSSTIFLPEVVIRVQTDTVRALNSGTWTLLRYHDPNELLQRYGALEEEAAADPWAFWLRGGEADLQGYALKLFPTPATSVADGLRYVAYVRPPDLSSDTDTPELPLHDPLIDRVLQRMAAADGGRHGDFNAARYYAEQARSTTQRFSRLAADSRADGPRRVRLRYFDR